MLGQLSQTHFRFVPTLDDIVSHFVNVKFHNESAETLSQDPEKCDKDKPNGSKVLLSPASGGGLKKSSRSSLGINLRSRNPYGEYPIHLACKKGDAERLKKILQMPEVDVNVVDYNNNTPLHEAVLNGRIECVKLLLNFVPHPTIDNFFPAISKQGNSPAKKVNRYVNLLASDNFEETPLQYAVINNQVEILHLILQFLETEDKKERNHFPKLAKVFECHGDKKLEDFSTSAEVSNILARYRPVAKLILTRLSRDLVNTRQFQVLLENSLQRYIAAHNLFLVYRLWKVSKVDPEYSFTVLLQQSRAGHAIELHKDLVRFQPIDYNDAVPFTQFDDLPRFDLYRSKFAVAKDVKTLENLKFPDIKLTNLEQDNPVRQFLSLFAY